MKTKGLLLVAGVLVAALLASCASGPAASGPEPPAKAALPEEKVYPGKGQDPSMLKAMNEAKMDAVRQAVIELIGAAGEKANQAKLQQFLYGTNNPNAYVNNETFQTSRKDKVGDDYIFEATVAVKMRAVESTLKAQGIIGGEGLTPQQAAAAGAPAAGAQQAVAATATEGPVAGAEPTAEERLFISRYLEKMTYMVYFNEQSGEDPFYMKAAVGIANEYLTSNAMEAIDLAQVERLKKDQQIAYEEETGKSISMIQWIAQKLNADVYLEIDGRTTGESAQGNYYGQANITLKGFEASTGRLLGSQPWNSPRTFSTASEQAARINALQTSVYKAMPVVIEQAKTYMDKALRNGIKYELVVQQTADARMISDFYRKMRRKVKDISTVSQSAEETKYSVYLIGSIEDLVDAVYDVGETVAGMQGLYQVVLRGKSVTFNTGL